MANDMYDLGADFEWDDAKDAANLDKHGISFLEAQAAFGDERRVIVRDDKHSHHEDRYFCVGKIDGGIVMVRFTRRGSKIRIFGAGYWREGRERYEKENRIF